MANTAQGKPEVVAEVSRKLAGIQGEWLHSRMHGMMEAAAAAMESFGGMKPPSVVEGNGAEAQVEPQLLYLCLAPPSPVVRLDGKVEPTYLISTAHL